MMKKIIVSCILLLLLCSCTRFDQDTWLNEPEKRQEMISSLTSNYNLINMTENEIIDLLGEPAQKLSTPSTQFLYYAGGAGFFGINVAVFQITFNDSGRVESHDIIFK